MNTLKNALETDKFIITAEAGPPKGTDVQEMLHSTSLLKEKVDAVNVTDNQSSVMRLGSLGASKLILEHGLDPIYQLTCRDRNRLAIQSDLLSAHVLGIRNVLALTGDHTQAGDHKQAKPVFDIESVQLLQVISTLNRGMDMNGNLLKGKTEFTMGATVTPEADPIEPQILKFEKKVKAGAQFFQTQAVYDTKKMEEFMETARHFPVKIIGGILLLKSAKMARFLNKFVPGIRVPDELINELEKSEKPLETGIQIAARQINEFRSICDGVHVMAIGMEDKVPLILEKAGI
ncbi:MAG: methylenetetrahydrofolate reductase [bacterium]